MLYIVEVYRGNQKAERHLGIYALYVMFYPQLVAGPIERPQNLLHQFREKHLFDYSRVTSGLKLMAWGLFLKVVIADRMVLVVDAVYNNPTAHTGPAFVLATMLFAIQIYCDFCGYSTIAIGAAKVMGFHLMQNFNHPYQARTIAEFWRRWHISLSTWFKDYVYFPLGGNRVGRVRWAFNILTVFTLSGIWHGASWNFIIWGLLHGLYVIGETLTQEVREKLFKLIGINRHSILSSFLQNTVVFVLVCTAWVFFRAHSLHDAIYIFTHLSDGWEPVSRFFSLKKIARLVGVDRNEILLILFAVISLLIAGLIHRRKPHFYLTPPFFVRWLFYYFIIGSILFLGFWGEKQFIYFQF